MRFGIGTCTAHLSQSMFRCSGGIEGYPLCDPDALSCVKILGLQGLVASLVVVCLQIQGSYP